MPMTTMNALKALFNFHEDFVGRLAFSCRPGCSTCCSVNVSITSLEASYLCKHTALSDTRLQERINAANHRPHFIPTVTTNKIAQYCLRQQKPPEEEGIHAPGQCPLLDSEGLCSVYENRPFSCRAMSSIQRCQADGEAVIPPILMTINLAVYQLIEHLDAAGTSGNMLNMLAGDERNRIPNTPFPGFLITEREKAPFQRFLQKIKKYSVDRKLLADFFPPQTFYLH